MKKENVEKKSIIINFLLKIKIFLFLILIFVNKMIISLNYIFKKNIK